MKRVSYFVLSCLIVVSLTACADSEKKQSADGVSTLESSNNYGMTMEEKISEISMEVQSETNEQPQVDITEHTLSWQTQFQLDTKPDMIPEATTVPQQDTDKTEEDMIPVQMRVGNQIFNMKLDRNETTQALMKRMPMTIRMDELNGNEKFYYLQDSLPVDFHTPSGIKSGDFMLYGSDCLVLFYESFSTAYSYTRLGKVENPERLAEALGQGSAEVTIGFEQNMVEIGNEKEETMKISVTTKETTIIYELNESTAAKELYAQFPAGKKLKNYPELLK